MPQMEKQAGGTPRNLVVEKWFSRDPGGDKNCAERYATPGRVLAREKGNLNWGEILRHSVTKREGRTLSHQGRKSLDRTVGTKFLPIEERVDFKRGLSTHGMGPESGEEKSINGRAAK